MLPDEVLDLPISEQLRGLERQFGAQLYAAFDPDGLIPSPLAGHTDTQWIKTANTVGVNVRTIGHFWNLVPYVQTLPAAQQAIHILPVWEPGVVASLYGPVSWNINPEFFSAELATLFPALDTVEKQLRVVVNLLHLDGRAVGMDVVPHTDRYSEMAVANPRYFEWLQRRELLILRHDAGFYREVERKIMAFLHRRGSAIAGLTVPESEDDFFALWPESERLRVMFGEKYDYPGRLRRRKEMVQMLYEAGIETVPATMGPPYRGLEVDPDPEACTRDEDGRSWRDYRITQPQAMSRVFGPLTRYKLYHPKNDNRDWELDFDQPNRPAWDYVCTHYRRIQAEFGFDFMRGDMSHVQMRPEGVPVAPDDHYDLHRAVKETVLREKPWFGYFAESFLAPPGTMAYGDECDHLEASLADSTLGDLQAEPVGTASFVRDFARYCNYLETRRFAPNFTLMTADKDDPRFDRFYLDGNEIRYFVALFLSDMPSYMSLGFECRDPHPEPVANEFYSKLYVFQMTEGPKATSGPFRWGQNRALYAKLARQKELSAEIFPKLQAARTRWLRPPDPAGRDKIIAWTQAEDPRWVFIANFDTQKTHTQVEIPLPEGLGWEGFFSTERADFQLPATTALRILSLLPGEGLGFRRAPA